MKFARSGPVRPRPGRSSLAGAGSGGLGRLWAVILRIGRQIETVDGLPGAPLTARHQVRVRPEREPWIAVTEVLAQGPDVLAGAQQQGGVEVPEGVHPVLARGRVALARLRLGDGAGGGQGGLPMVVVEDAHAYVVALDSAEDEPLGHERAVRRTPGKRQIGSHSLEWSRRSAATALGSGTSRALPPLGRANTYLPRMRLSWWPTASHPNLPDPRASGMGHDHSRQISFSPKPLRRPITECA